MRLALAALLLVVPLLAACERGAPPGASSAAPAQPPPPAPATREATDPDAPFLTYMRAVAPLAYEATNGAGDGVSDCIDDQDHAPDSATEAARCLQRHVTAHEALVRRLEAVSAPPDQADRHRRLIDAARADGAGLRSIAAAVGERAPRIDRARRGHRLTEFYLDDDHREAEGLRNAVTPVTDRSRETWNQWLDGITPQCNERLRCINGGPAAELVRRGEARGATANPPYQNNCPCVRVWRALTSTNGEAIFTAQQSGLPPFRGGV